jgi:hypothetical protein
MTYMTALEFTSSFVLFVMPKSRLLYLLTSFSYVGLILSYRTVYVSNSKVSMHSSPLHLLAE